MKPNEIVGVLGMIAAFVTLVIGLLHGYTPWHLIIGGAFIIVETAFLSLWGLWTFNPWVESIKAASR